MKKISIALLMVVVMLMVSGCGSSTSGNTTAAQGDNSKETVSQGQQTSDKAYTMRIAHILDEQSIRHRSLVQFKEAVEKGTNGGVKVELFSSATLGSDDELIEQVKNGSIEGYRGSEIDVVIPEYNIYSMPFLFANVDEAAAVMNSDWGKALAEKSQVNGIDILATGTSGMRVLTNNKRPVHSPEDLKGMKLRTPSWDVTIKTFADALGVNCTSIPYNETYMALKTGVADGQENPWVYIVNPKFYEVQKYATDLNWNLTLEYFPVNKEWFDSLPAEYQNVIKDAATASMEYNNEANKNEEKEYIDICSKYMEITYLTAEERQAFVDATQSVYEYYIGTGLFTKEDIETIKGIIKDYNGSH